MITLCATLFVGAPLPGSSDDRAAAGSGARKHKLRAYRGLGTWADIFNWEPWRHPVISMKGMKKHGVQTLFLETSRYTRHASFAFPQELGRVLEAAHAEGIRVVAWYLPGLVDLREDFVRSRDAILYRSPNGHRFDGFALNLESPEVADIDARSRRAVRLSRKLRKSIPRSYPLGAIVVDPVHAGWWPRYPYRKLGRIYDVLLPMSYWTYRGVSEPWKVKQYVNENIRALRRKTRGSKTAIHVPGGIAKKTSNKATRAFVRTIKRRKVFGGSLYDYPLTRREQWPILRRLRTNRR